jgi:hypothetical protein
MKNRALHRRLAAVESEANRGAKVMQLEPKSISGEDALREYRRMISPSSTAPSKDWSKLTAHHAMEKYLALVKGSTASNRRKLYGSSRY